jgi:hypothetical protein
MRDMSALRFAGDMMSPRCRRAGIESVASARIARMPPRSGCARNL